LIEEPLDGRRNMSTTHCGFHDRAEPCPRCAIYVQPKSPSPQRQDSLNDQLRDLQTLANKHGMYDAADFLRNVLEKKP
jgi:hypothetical protein